MVPKPVYDTFKDTIAYLNGRYVVRLPWKAQHPVLPDNYHLAWKRFQSLVRKLRKDAEVATKCDEVNKGEQKALGVSWNQVSDRIAVDCSSIAEAAQSCMPTKRNVISYLTYLTTDADDCSSDPTYQPDRSLLANRKKVLDRVLTEFWHRWSTEYLAALREQHRPNSSKHSGGEVGDIVVLCDPDRSRTTWRLGKVEIENCRKGRYIKRSSGQGVRQEWENSLATASKGNSCAHWRSVLVMLMPPLLIALK